MKIGLATKEKTYKNVKAEFMIRLVNTVWPSQEIINSYAFSYFYINKPFNL